MLILLLPSVPGKLAHVHKFFLNAWKQFMLPYLPYAFSSYIFCSTTLYPCLSKEFCDFHKTLLHKGIYYSYRNLLFAYFSCELRGLYS